MSPDHDRFAPDRTPPRPAAREIQALLDCAATPGRAPHRRMRGGGTAALRALAHGAAREVVGGGAGAVDAALDVCLAEIEALRARLAAQTEVIKLVRSYAEDDWLRSMAGAVLEARDVDLARCLPRTLFDPDLADAVLPAHRRPLG